MGENDEAAGGASPDDFDLTIDEWCARKSVDDRRVETISAFFALEKAAGRVKASASVFASRFQAFVSAPV